ARARSNCRSVPRIISFSGGPASAPALRVRQNPRKIGTELKGNLARARHNHPYAENRDQEGFMSRSSSVLATFLLITACIRSETVGAAAPGTASASSVKEGSDAAGALDGDRFSAAPAACWKGRPGERVWYWQVRFAQPRSVGAILQVVGDG